MKINVKLLSALSLMTAAGAAMAADAPSLSKVLEASGITATGYVEAGYEYVSTIPSYRVFDTEHSAFSLHQAAFSLAYQPKDGFGALVNITTGNDAEVIHSTGSFDSGSFDVTQAFVQYAGGPVTIIAGKYVTLAGAEVINSTGDTNLSRSVLFGYAIPFTHTGVRATFAASDEISFIVGVNNGWDQVRDLNTQKTAELGVAYTTKPFVLAAQAYLGSEPTAVGGGQRQLLDIVATFNATDSLSFVLNLDYGKQQDTAANTDAKWAGLAGYVNYAINDTWRLSFRAENFDDKDGYRLNGPQQKVKEGTFTLAAMPSKSAEVRFEVRYDKSDKQSFTETNGMPTDKQYSLGVEALYKF